MRYLFYDTECAYGRGGICEFGYVITDENFNYLREDNLLINPHIKFDDYGHKKAGIVFAYSKNEYYSSPDIMDRYDEIKALLTAPDTVVIGYATDSDAKFLINDLDRFDLPPINYVFWDVMRMYRFIAKRESGLKLDILYAETGCSDLMHHQALYDSKMTIEVLKKLLRDYNLTFSDVQKNYKMASGESYNGRIVIRDGSVFNYTKGGRTTVANRKILDDYIKNEPISLLSNKFEGKIFSIAPDVVKENFAVTMALCEKSKKRGGQFTLSICDAHYLLVGEKSKIPRQRMRRGVKLLKTSDMERLLELDEGSLSDEKIDIDGLIGELPENVEWYKEYLKNH